MCSGSTKKLRLDKLLFDKGLADSREKAKAIILEGAVLVNGEVVDKAGAMVRTDDSLEIKSRMPYVSRGGLKLEHAIDYFKVTPVDKTAMDVGASTGGFTDCLLQNHAKKVYSVDVGYGQFSWKLRNDARVILLEKTNIRHLSADKVRDVIDLVTIDVSFISLLKVIPHVIQFLNPGGEIIALIKPQFEVGKKDVGKGGVVRDENKRLEAVEKVKKGAEELNLESKGITQSPIKGPKGNVEFLIYLKKPDC